MTNKYIQKIDETYDKFLKIKEQYNIIKRTKLNFNRFLTIKNRKVSYHLNNDGINFNDLDIYYEFRNNKYYLKNKCKSKRGWYDIKVNTIKPSIINIIENDIITDFKTDKIFFNKLKKEHQYFIKRTQLIENISNKFSDKRNRIINKIKKYRKKLIFPGSIIKPTENIILEGNRNQNYKRIEKLSIIRKNPKSYTVYILYKDGETAKKYMKKRNLLKLITISFNKFWN